MASPAARSSSSCGRLSPTPRSTASPTRSRAPTCAPTKYDLVGTIPKSFSRKTEGLKDHFSQTVYMRHKRRRRFPGDRVVATSIRTPGTGAGGGCSSSDHYQLHVELAGPGLPGAIPRVGRAGQTPGQRETDPVGQAQPGAMAVEGGGEACVEATEGSHRDTHRLHLGIHPLHRDVETDGLLENLGIVDRADGRGLVCHLATTSQPCSWFRSVSSADASRTIEVTRELPLRPQPPRDAPRSARR